MGTASFESRVEERLGALEKTVADIENGKLYARAAGLQDRADDCAEQLQQARSEIADLRATVYGGDPFRPANEEEARELSRNLATDMGDLAGKDLLLGDLLLGRLPGVLVVEQIVPGGKMKRWKVAGSVMTVLRILGYADADERVTERAEKLLTFDQPKRPQETP